MICTSIIVNYLYPQSIISRVYVERDINERFEFLTGIYDMVAIVGPRQSGKTTFLRMRLTGDASSYVLLDDLEARRLFEESPRIFEQRYLEGREVTVLDEVQHCSGAGQTLKYFVDTGRRLWITSSSEVLMSRDVLSYLVGRVSILRLYPFSLPEYLRARGETAFDRGILERLVWEHMTFGGYPRVVLANDPEAKRTILGDLRETMLFKDVSRTFSIDKLDPLTDLCTILASTPGMLLSYDHLSSTLDLSFRTVKKYLSALEQSYMVTIVPPFFKNRSKEVSKQPRAYYVDTGLRNLIMGAFNAPPDGRLFENYVLTELMKMGHDVKHWRTKGGAEVDFVVDLGRGVVPVECKLRSRPPRLGSGLKSFIRTYGPAEAYVVNHKGKAHQVEVGGCTVRFVNVLELWEFLGREEANAIQSRGGPQ